MFENIENLKDNFGLNVIVALNKYNTDTEAEIEFLQNWAKENGHEISLTEVFAKGGLGGVDLATKVVNVIESGVSNYHPLYNESMTVLEKIENIINPSLEEILEADKKARNLAKEEISKKMVNNELS